MQLHQMGHLFPAPAFFPIATDFKSHKLKDSSCECFFGAFCTTGSRKHVHVSLLLQAQRKPLYHLHIAISVLQLAPCQSHQEDQSELLQESSHRTSVHPSRTFQSTFHLAHSLCKGGLKTPVLSQRGTSRLKTRANGSESTVASAARLLNSRLKASNSEVWPPYTRPTFHIGGEALLSLESRCCWERQGAVKSRMCGPLMLSSHFRNSCFSSQLLHTSCASLRWRTCKICV